MSLIILTILVVIGITITILFIIPLLSNLPLSLGSKFKRVNENLYLQGVLQEPLACSKHHTRLIEKGSFDTDHINCRMHPSCYKNGKIINADRIIGIIGKDNITNQNGIDHVFELYNIENNFLRDGDFDIIKIYNNPNIKDYDKLLTKMTSIYYNQLRRLKPINEVTVMIYGTVPLSKNTKRYLREKFLNVKYYYN